MIGTIANTAAIIVGSVVGGTVRHGLKETTCFLADLNDFEKFNAEYAEHFISDPARECVQAAKLPKNALVEISAIAEAR